MRPAKDILALDIGNTRIKFSDGKISCVFSSSGLDEKELRVALKPYSKSIIGYSSVDAVTESLVLGCMEDATKVKLSLYFTHDLCPIKKILSTGTGSDRILGIVGALRHSTPPIITIDFGTATTYNVLDEKYNFLGGAIAPGIETLFKCLHQATANLPLVQPLSEYLLIGKTTEDAILSGVMNSTIGAVLFMVEEIQNKMLKGKSAGIFLSGGNAQYVADALGKRISCKVIDDLVLEGILELTTRIKNEGLLE